MKYTAAEYAQNKCVGNKKTERCGERAEYLKNMNINVHDKSGFRLMCLGKQYETNDPYYRIKKKKKDSADKRNARCDDDGCGQCACPENYVNHLSTTRVRIAMTFCI